MPALTSVKDFVAGAVLTAANMDEVNCGVKVFANAAARDAAYGGSGERTLEEGEMCYLNDTNQVLVYNGSSWVNAGGVGNAVISTAAGSYQGTVHEGGTVFDVWTYNASGSLVVTTAGLVDMLLVGAGAGGGNGYSGGGGGGGHLFLQRAYLPSGTLTVTVPAGGAAGRTGPYARVGEYFSPGGGSSELRSSGGGGGSRGIDGACGGGCTVNSGSTGGSALMPSPHGNGGGTGTGTGAGGGGGAGGNGANPSGGNGGAGGTGAANSITGTSVTRCGGGGGGGVTTGGAGGTGGGGAGGAAGGNGTAASPANSGGGGGGGGVDGSTGGAAGASGLVAVRAAR